MANERTEQATPKRRGETRQKGQVVKSEDLKSAIMLTLGIILIFMLSPFIVEKLRYITVMTFTNLDPALINRESFWGFFAPYMTTMLVILLPILLILMICGIVYNYVTIGPLFTLDPIKPNFSKLSPSTILKGFKRFFEIRSLVELGKSIIKMIIVGGVAYSVIHSRENEILALLGAELSQVLAVICSIIGDMLIRICIVLILLGFADFKYQQYEFDKSIKMTKEEVKDERKNSEGNPQIKSHIKNIQMKFAMQRMMTAVPSADVIVTNPTHYAIALRYDTTKAPAPQVVAKGVDFVAFKIREIAENNNIPIVENKPLARTLYKIVPLDGLIPADLYVAVAEVLAFVYKTNKGKVR